VDDGDVPHLPVKGSKASPVIVMTNWLALAKK